MCRREKNAPVDILGCGSLADPDLKDRDPPAYRFQALVAGLLSSQTKDEVTAAAVERLQQYECCSIDGILQMEDYELEQILHPVSFYKRKAGYLKKCAAVLKEAGGDIPGSAKELKKLPGVGPKIAYLVSSVAWGKVEGICVDTHVHRIANRLGWATTKQPEQTRVALQKWLPQRYWWPLNQLFVGFGQQMCSALHPQCNTCPLSNNGLCPSTTHHPQPLHPAPATRASHAEERTREMEQGAQITQVFEQLRAAPSSWDDPGGAAAADAEAFADAQSDSQPHSDQGVDSSSYSYYEEDSVERRGGEEEEERGGEEEEGGGGGDQAGKRGGTGGSTGRSTGGSGIIQW
jgi:endonuclease-3